MKHPVIALAWSPDGKWLASGEGDIFLLDWHSKTNVSVSLWDWRKSSLSQSWNGQKIGVHLLQFSSDGQYLATASREGVRIRELRSGKVVWRDQRNAVPGVKFAFSPSGKFFVVNGHELGVWSWPESKLLRRLKQKHTKAEFISFGTKEHLLYAVDGRNLACWDIQQGQLRKFHPVPNRFKECIVWPNDGTLACSPQNGALQLRSTETGALRDTLLTGQVALSPDGSAIAYNRGTAVELYRGSMATPHRRIEHSRNGTTIYSLAFSPDGRTLAVGDDQGFIMLVRVK
jgi:WD40 repeat protein